MLFEASPMPMWVYDADTLAFLAVNDAAIRHYGYSREEFLAMRITDIRPPEDVPAMLADVKARGGPGSPTPKVWRHLRKDGSLITVEITAGRITFEGRKAALVLAHDVTERLRLEQRLADAEKMEAIGRLAGGVAHDFNNLLTVIAGYAEILERARRAARRRRRSRAPPPRPPRSRTSCWPSAAARSCTRASLDLNQIVAGMETMLQRIIGDDVSVGIRLAPDLAPVEADRAQLERVILNLAANARDAMPGGGVLTIETANVDVDEAQVADPRRRRARPARPARGLRHRHRHGRGRRQAPLRAVLHHQGRRRRDRARPRDGVRRRQAERRRDLRLQRAGPRQHVQDLPAGGRRAAPSRSSAVAEPEAERGSETIMVVEDDEGVRELVRLMLEANGYEVLTVDDADEAARAVHARAASTCC